MIKNLPKIIFVLLGLSLASLLWNENDKVQVTFILESSSLSADANVYLVGSHKKLGAWQPDKIKMKYLGIASLKSSGNKAGAHRWQKQLNFENGDILEYKFTQGNWANEGANPQGLPLENNYLTVSKNQTVITKVNHWRTAAEFSVQGKITGTVEYHRQLTGQGILPRDIIVWLPPDYQQNKDKHYPVLYMHDGQNIIDPNTASFKVDWAVDETLTRLIKEQQVPSTIIKVIKKILKFISTMVAWGWNNDYNQALMTCYLL